MKNTFFVRFLNDCFDCLCLVCTLQCTTANTTRGHRAVRWEHPPQTAWLPSSNTSKWAKGVKFNVREKLHCRNGFWWICYIIVWLNRNCSLKIFYEGVDHCCLSRVPTEITFLSKLTYLTYHCFHNHQLFTSIYTSLIYNSLTEIPSEIGFLRSLTLLC